MILKTARSYRVGASLLITLLSDPSTAVFTSLPNSCYLQISGTPLCDLKPKSTLMEVKKRNVDALDIVGERAATKKRKRTRNCKRSRGSKRKQDGLVEVGAGKDISMDEDDEAMWRDAGGDLPLAAFDTSIVLELPKIMPVNAKRRKLGPSISLPQLMLRSRLTSTSVPGSSDVIAIPRPKLLRSTTSFTDVTPIMPMRRAASVEIFMGDKRLHRIRKVEAT
jgi:hypothetical protein